MSHEPRKIIPRRPERLILPGWAVALVLAGIIVLLTGGVLLVARTLRTGRTVLEPIAQDAAPPSSVANPTAPGISGYQLWGGTERVTVLVLGVDERQSEFGPWRTDTMIVLTIDPLTQTGGMLSIPRDLWVDIPGVGQDRINTANFHGDANRSSGGGPALVTAVVEQTLGITVDNYILLNFAGFVGFIDTIGCIGLDVPVDIADPTYPASEGFGFEPFYMSAGNHQRVCGEEALKYARTRATFGSDFDRAARQQQVIYAVRDQMLRPERMPVLLAKLPEISSTLQAGVSSNLTLEQMVGLGLLAIKLDDESVRSEVLDGRYTSATTVEIEGMPQLVLLPKENAIASLVRDMFTRQEGSPAVDELLQLVTQEQATISVLNGTPTGGLAETATSLLLEKGIAVQDSGEAGRSDYVQTIIYDNGGKISTARYLAVLLGVPEDAIIQTGDPHARYDIQIVLGSDAFP